ncbi:Centlein, partial [Dissostichus eleginoides]
MLRVQAAMDRATVKELHLCLADEHQELLHKVVEERQVKSSTPKKLSVSSQRMEQSFKKIEQLERRMVSLEEDTERLKEEKEQLLEANEDLAHNCRRLQASLDHLRTQEAVREEAARAQALAQGERHRGEITALQGRLAASQKDATKLHHQQLKLRQELGILRAARDFHRNRAAAAARAGGTAGNISGKVKLKTTRLRGPLPQRRHRTLSPNQAISWQGRSPSPTKDEWEDLSVVGVERVGWLAELLGGPTQHRGDNVHMQSCGVCVTHRSKLEMNWVEICNSGEEYEDSLNGGASRTMLHRRHTDRKKDMAAPNPREICPSRGDMKRGKMGTFKDILSPSPSVFREEAELDPLNVPISSSRAHRHDSPGPSRRAMSQTKGFTPPLSSLQGTQRVESLQRHIDILRSARKDAVLSAKELRRANEKITAQLDSLSEKLCSSKQLTQKLTSDLAGKEQQKKVLEMELEQWRRITLPQQTAPAAPVNAECCCRGRTMPSPANPVPQVLEAEVKQLQARLKSASAEVTRQVAANKALRGQLQEKEEKLRQLQDKANHTERDVSMKRQLVEDLKTRLKFLQEMENSYRGQVEDLEKKRRLSVATTEKSQYDASCKKLKEELEKKEQRMHALQARVGASEQALAALEQTATEQMKGLTQQSSNALDRLQRQLGQAHSHLEQLHAFIKRVLLSLASPHLTIYSKLSIDRATNPQVHIPTREHVQEVKQQLMKRRRSRQASAVAAKGGLSAKSMIKAKSIAASILNMSENDLADIMDTDQAAGAHSEGPGDQEWLNQLNHILQQK